MIQLAARGTALGLSRRVIGRVTRTPLPSELRGDHVFVGNELPPSLQGYAGIVTGAARSDVAAAALTVPIIAEVGVGHLETGDVVSLDARGEIRTLYRRNSNHNAIFATDNCNSYCLMCSQPPRKVDDGYRIAENLRLIDLIDSETRELGFTGGEPTLLKDGFFAIVQACKDKLPTTALHILSNGRMFFYPAFAQRLAAIEHPNLMVGVPLYSDLDDQHDYVVQARGAFEQTIIGLHNLGRYGVPVEIRVVVHRLTCDRLTELAAFIYRNVTFASHVTFMGLELMGLAVANRESLWIDPWDYRQKLESATLFLAARGMNVSIYNHQLCTIPQTLWPYARKSISDWKNEYLPVCGDCSLREGCGGFFSSTVQRDRWSAHVDPKTAV